MACRRGSRIQAISAWWSCSNQRCNAAVRNRMRSPPGIKAIPATAKPSRMACAFSCDASPAGTRTVAPLLHSPVPDTYPSRLAGLLRWIGGVLVILLGLELLAVLVVNAWDEEAFRQLVVDTLITNGPMALIGLSLMLLASRIDLPAQGRTPMRWTVMAVGGLLSLAMFVAVPVTIAGNRLIQADADQAVTQKRGELERAESESQEPKLLEVLEGQLVQAGQVAADAKPEDKKAQVQVLIDQRLDQLRDQLTQAERARDLTMGQRQLGGTVVALVLALAFLAVALAAVL